MFFPTKQIKKTAPRFFVQLQDARCLQLLRQRREVWPCQVGAADQGQGAPPAAPVQEIIAKKTDKKQYPVFQLKCVRIAEFNLFK